MKFERLSGESVKLRKRNRKKNCPSTSMNSTPILQWLDVRNVISWEIDWGDGKSTVQREIDEREKEEKEEWRKEKASPCNAVQSQPGREGSCSPRGLAPSPRTRKILPLLIFPALLLHVSKCNWLWDGSAREESPQFFVVFSNFTANFTPNYFTLPVYFSLSFSLSKLTRILMKVFIVSRNFIVAISLH